MVLLFENILFESILFKICFIKAVKLRIEEEGFGYNDIEYKNAGGKVRKNILQRLIKCNIMQAMAKKSYIN